MNDFLGEIRIEIQPESQLNNDNLEFQEICEICMETKSKTEFIQSTGKCQRCKYCKDCIQEYLFQRIKFGFNGIVPCLNEICENYFEKIDIQKILKPEQISYYEKQLLRLKVEQNKNLFWCSGVDCENILDINNSKKMENTDKEYFQCEKCLNFTCYQCNNDQHGILNCQDGQNNLYEQSKQKLEIQKCPKCKIDVQKIEGCNHITCAKCNYQFCWVCLGKYSAKHFSSSLLNIYCRNMGTASWQQIMQFRKQRKFFPIIYIFRIIAAILLYILLGLFFICNFILMPLIIIATAVFSIFVPFVRAQLNHSFFRLFRLPYYNHQNQSKKIIINLVISLIFYPIFYLESFLNLTFCCFRFFVRKFKPFKIALLILAVPIFLVSTFCFYLIFASLQSIITPFIFKEKMSTKYQIINIQKFLPKIKILKYILIIIFFPIFYLEALVNNFCEGFFRFLRKI